MILVEHVLEVYPDQGPENDAKVSTVRQARYQSRSEGLLVDIGSVVPQQECASLVPQVARRLPLGVYDDRPFLSDVNRFLDCSWQTFQRALQYNRYNMYM